MQTYLKEFNEASGFKRILFQLYGSSGTSEAVAGLFAVGVGAILICKTIIRRRLSPKFKIDNAIEIWICLQFMGLAESAFDSTNLTLQLFFASTWISASVHFYRKSSKQEY